MHKRDCHAFLNTRLTPTAKNMGGSKQADPPEKSILSLIIFRQLNYPALKT